MYVVINYAAFSPTVIRYERCDWPITSDLKNVLEFHVWI